MQPFPHPNDATHKIWSRLANWLQRYSNSKVWNFHHSRASNSKMSGLIRPKIKLGSKATEKRWRHHFPHYKSIGAFCCHGHQSFDPICPKTLGSLSPTPMMLGIKSDQDWPTGFRDIKVRKCEIFRHSRAGNSKMSGLIRPKIKLDQAFMPVLVTSNFDDDSIINEWASMETAFSHYKSMGNFLAPQGQLTP